MPTYEAKCLNCSFKFYYSRAISKRDDSPKCPDCLKATKRVWTQPEGGFILKGKGWYKSGAFGGKSLDKKDL